MDEQQLVDAKEEKIIQQIVDNAKQSPLVQTLDAIFGMVENKGEKDGR